MSAHAYLAGPEPTHFRTVIERALLIMEARVRNGRFVEYMSYVGALDRKKG